jgi:hypothetical protein
MIWWSQKVLRFSYRRPWSLNNRLSTVTRRKNLERSACRGGAGIG